MERGERGMERGIDGFRVGLRGIDGLREGYRG